ncbi:hypothetical protein INR49_026561 [Caranx melampygus]|nr:hypothetical protein INR49_026561 [Caranx melampygus]
MSSVLNFCRDVKRDVEMSKQANALLFYPSSYLCLYAVKYFAPPFSTLSSTLLLFLCTSESKRSVCLLNVVASETDVFTSFLHYYSVFIQAALLSQPQWVKMQEMRSSLGKEKLTLQTITKKKREREREVLDIDPENISSSVCCPQKQTS